MPVDNTSILEQANAALREGDHEGFLVHCTDDTEWTFVGERTLRGKDAVRRWMDETYAEPPSFDVQRLLADGDLVVAIGEITLPDESGTPVRHAYCDVWHFRNGRMAALQAFVVGG